MNNWRTIKFLPLCGTLFLIACTELHAQQKPNIVFFLVDDLGQRDLGCYGSQFYETPAIDNLAKEGMLFDNAYATCHVCSPSRASILTGKYPARTNLTEWLRGRPEREYEKLHHGEKLTALPAGDATRTWLCHGKLRQGSSKTRPNDLRVRRSHHGVGPILLSSVFTHL